MMKQLRHDFGLIGFPLEHSWSARWFHDVFKKEEWSKASYRLFPMPDLNGFHDLIFGETFLRGLNVTIPYKEKIIPLLDELDEQAQKVGAVNLICISRDNNRFFTKGYNTDITGFEKSLALSGIDSPGRALVLGTGGASRAVCHVLSRLGWDFLQVSRNPGRQGVISYADINASALSLFPVIINTTPVGMYPNSNECPAIPYHELTPQNTLYDLIYNPASSLFLQKGQQAGCRTVNGYSMLALQAARGWEIWKTHMQEKKTK